MITLKILVFILIFESIELKKCVYDQSLNYCLVDDFVRIRDVNIECENNIFSSLVLVPTYKIAFDEKLKINNCKFYSVYLNNFKSFSIETKLFDDIFDTAIISNSDILFSFNHTINFVQNFFNKKFKFIRFNRVGYFSKTPRLAFKDANLSSLTFDHMVDTKLLKNYLTFENDSDVTELNSLIDELELCLFKLDLDHFILDQYVFKNLTKLRILYQPKGIEVGILKPFVHLKELELSLFSLKSFFHTSGIKWIIGLNSLVILNYSNNLTTIDKSKQVIVSLVQNYFGYQEKVGEYTYPNEDFCLFIDFPHKNFVFPIIEKCFNTCTFQWLVQYHYFLEFDYYTKCNLENSTLACNYSLMAEACFDNYENIIAKKIDYYENKIDLYVLNDQNYKNKLYDLVLSVYMIPPLSLLGMFTNLLNILTLRSKKFEKEFKNRMFKQMLICSYINLIICMIDLLALTIKCVDPFGYFCMLILVHLKIYRYVLLTVNIYIASALKTCSKLVQIAISLDRFILSTGTKNKHLLKFAKLDLKLSILIFLIFSFAINFIKIFEYKYSLIDDADRELTFPFIYIYFFDFYFVYSYFNLLNILVNNLCLLLFQVMTDFALLFFIQKSIENKKKVLDSIQNLKNNTNHRAEKSIKMMIIFNGAFVFILHSPDLIVSIWIAFTYSGLEYRLEMLDLFSHVLNNISEICYILSYSLNFFLFYYFNSNFRNAFQVIFGCMNKRK
jgi:hypothetical protein